MSAVPSAPDQSIVSKALPSLDSLELQGHQAFSDVLNHPEFRSFFEPHFDRARSLGDDCRLLWMILKLFTDLRKRCAQETGKEPSPFELVSMVHTVMNETDSRRFICQTVSEQVPMPRNQLEAAVLPTVKTLELRPYSWIAKHGKGRGFDCMYPDGSHLTLSLQGVRCDLVTSSRFHLVLRNKDRERYHQLIQRLEERLRKALSDDSVQLAIPLWVKHDTSDMYPTVGDTMEKVTIRLTRFLYTGARVWTALWCFSSVFQLFQ